MLPPHCPRFRTADPGTAAQGPDKHCSQENAAGNCSCLRLGGQEGLHLHADHAPAGSVRKVDVVKVAEEGLRVGIRELCQ